MSTESQWALVNVPVPMAFEDQTLSEVVARLDVPPRVARRRMARLRRELEPSE